MQKPLHSIFFYILLFIFTNTALVVSLQTHAQTKDYTLANHVEIRLKTEQVTYPFIADGMEGRFNNRLRRLEFILPWQQVNAVKNVSDMAVFQAVFKTDNNNIEGSDALRLFVYLPEDMRNFDNLRNGRTLTLNGECVIAGTRYKMPVTMELFYNNEYLNYGLDMAITSAFNPVMVSTNQAALKLNQIQFVMREGGMRVFFEQ